MRGRVVPSGERGTTLSSVSGSSGSIVLFVVASTFVGGCDASPNARVPVGPSRKVVPNCTRGSFAEDLERAMPPFDTAASVDLFAATAIERSIEPGCIVPFREKPGLEAMIDVGAVVGFLTPRTLGGKPIALGRGTLQVGRETMRLSLHDAGGDETLGLEVDGARVRVRRKGAPAFEAVIDLASDEALSLPLDALIASLSRCDDDERLGASGDGNVVAAKRLGRELWRARWLRGNGEMAVDTSVWCDAGDARLAWRTVEGEGLPSLSLASARAPVTMRIEREAPSWTEDIAR